MDSMYFSGRRTSHSRRDGALVGIVVAAAFALSVADTPVEDRTGVSVAFPAAMLLAGGLGGWLLGPAAMQATTARSWAGVIIGLAAVAAVSGAFVVTLPLAVQITATMQLEPLDGLVGILSTWLALGVLGVLVLGIPSLLMTLLPAGIWAAAMAWLQARRSR